MTLKSYFKFCLASLLLTNSAFAIANNQIPCPLGDLFKNLFKQIDTVSMLEENKFMVYSYHSYTYDKESDLSWHVITSVTNTPDFNTAFAIGQNNIKKISAPKEKYAQKSDDHLICHYVDSAGVTVAFALGESFSLRGSIKNTILKLSS